VNNEIRGNRVVIRAVGLMFKLFVVCIFCYG